MPHSLKAERIERRCKWREIVRDEIDLDQHASRQHKDANDQKAGTAIPEHPAQHDERREQSDAGKKNNAAHCFV